jgi:hypothetical protein
LSFFSLFCSLTLENFLVFIDSKEKIPGASIEKFLLNSVLVEKCNFLLFQGRL